MPEVELAQAFAVLEADMGLVILALTWGWIFTPPALAAWELFFAILQGPRE